MGIDYKKQGQFLKELRLANNLTQTEVADKLGVTHPTIIRYEKGEIARMKSSTIQKLAEIYNVDPVSILGIDLKNNLDIIPLKKIKTIPILGDICAGNGIWCEENYLGTIQIDDYIKADYCLVVHGDSMKGAGIHDGDYAFLKRQTVLENRDIGAVYFPEDNNVMLRRAFFGNEVATFYPENPEYEPIQSTEFIILGKLVGYYHEMR